MIKKYINIQKAKIKPIIKNKNGANWYLPKSGLWGDRYMDEKSDILTRQRNLKEIDIIKRYIKNVRDILDIPCGYGRISNALASRRYNVTGVDINKYFIDIARREADRKKLKINYLVKDMIEYKPRKRFDAVLNIFTSLGYYGSEADNEEFVNNLCRLVKSNGLLLIETINPIRLLRVYKKKSIKITKKGTKVLFENFFDYKTSVNTTKITERYSNGKINKTFHRIRLYYPHELINLCLKNNLVLKDILDEMGRSKDISSSMRMWLIFEKQNEIKS